MWRPASLAGKQSDANKCIADTLLWCELLYEGVEQGWFYLCWMSLCCDVMEPRMDYELRILRSVLATRGCTCSTGVFAYESAYSLTSQCICESVYSLTSRHIRLRAGVFASRCTRIRAGIFLALSYDGLRMEIIRFTEDRSAHVALALVYSRSLSLGKRSRNALPSYLVFSP